MLIQIILGINFHYSITVVLPSAKFICHEFLFSTRIGHSLKKSSHVYAEQSFLKPRLSVFSKVTKKSRYFIINFSGNWLTTSKCKTLDNISVQVMNAFSVVNYTFLFKD